MRVPAAGLSRFRRWTPTIGAAPSGPWGRRAWLAGPVDSAESQRASRRWWDADADDYLAEHGADLGDADFVWCPEGLREDDARLLGERGRADVLEVGAGSAPVLAVAARRRARGRWRWTCPRGMLRHAAALGARTGVPVPLVQAGAERLPFRAPGLRPGLLGVRRGAVRGRPGAG